VSSAALLLDRPRDREAQPRVGPRNDRFEREANLLADRLAWRMPAAAPTASADGGELPESVRSTAESELAYDFANVRVHAGPLGQAAAHRLGARAVALGNEIAFARGEYDPVTTEGRRTLAHELVHTAQQSPRAERSAVSHSPAGVAQRVAGVDAPDSWDELIGGPAFAPDSPDRRARGEEAKRRLLAIREGQRLVNSLWRLASRQSRLVFRIGITFVDQLPQHLAGRDPASGVFTPTDENASRYEVYVRQEQPSAPGTITLGGTTASGIPFAHTDPESEMATTLQHELLHVEFVRTVRGGYETSYPYEPRTGHGANPARNTDPWFLEHERAAHAQIDALEQDVHRRAEEQRRADEQRAADAERARQQQEELARPRATEPERREPSFLGGQAVARGGIVGLGSTRGTAIVGADLVLGRIDALHVGARGVFLSPGNLLAGATVGGRFFTTESPIYFDIEAGILAELPPATGARLTDRVAGIAGASLGHEFGTVGTRMFFDIGGFVIVTDRGQWGGGGTAGVGLRF